VNGFGLEFLEQYHKDSDELLNHIIRGDEIWVSFVNVETKEQSKQWMHTHSLNKPKNLNKLCLPKRKLMATVFWDRKGVLVVEFMQQGTTGVLQNTEYLHRAIQSKRCGMLTSDVVLLHCNSHLHTAARTQARLEHLNWELFDHPP
jgi:chorismate-pyruvate lyase